MTSINTLEIIALKAAREIRFFYVDELICEERTLKWFKSMYAQHAFDAMGEKFKNLYETQFKFVEKLKKSYREKYGS